MPESASAVSQLTEEEHSWGKQMKGAERGGGGASRESSAAQSASRWLMSGGSGGRFLAWTLGEIILQW